MKVKLDENLSRHLCPALEELGYDVDTVADEGLLSKPDPVIGAAASAEGRVLFTIDVEFADLRKHPPGTHPGIVLFRPHRRSIVRVRELVLGFAASFPKEQLVGSVVVVEEDKVRVRRSVP